MRKLHIRACTATSALGRGMTSHKDALLLQHGGLRQCDFDGVDLDTWIGRVDGLDGLESEAIKGKWAEYDCRNNRLAQAGLEQDDFLHIVADAVKQYGHRRIGVFIGTSTSGVQQTEWAYTHRDSEVNLPDNYFYQQTQNIFSCADYVQKVLQLEGPAQVVSTACSSSAKVFATAYRYMSAGLCDVAIVGGVDSLCQMTLYGFNALQLVSAQPCRPADQNRNGINIGEAAGFALLEWADIDSNLCLLGYGESSDAYHMSRPHPEGRGALLAMQQALERAELDAEQIDYLNLHGTATPANDASEDKAVFKLFKGQIPCSSTKGYTGHTLGAAGILEVALSCIAIEEGILPASLNTQQVDKNIHSRIVTAVQKQQVNKVMTNSFGFGGSNASLIIGRQS